MRWKNKRRSQRVDDRRGRGIAKGGAKLSGGVVIIAIIIAVITGQNPLTLLCGVMQQDGGQSQQVEIPQRQSPAQQQQADFSSVILASTEDVWTAIFKQQGQQYPAPTMVLFDGRVQSACGVNSEAVGPF